MEHCCLAFFDQENRAVDAYHKYWIHRTSENPRFLGYLLFNPDVHDSKWRSYKLLRFCYPGGRSNIIAFGIIGSKPQNPVHKRNGNSQPQPNPDKILTVRLPVQQTLDILSQQGLEGLTPHLVGNESLVNC